MQTYSTSELLVDLDALRENYRILRRAAEGAEVAAVVKADAYGLGMIPVAKALAREGCANFYVATLDEAVVLRSAMPAAGVGVLNGLGAREEAVFIAHGLLPVLNDLGQIQAWQRHAESSGKSLPAALQIDTGMNRLGLSVKDARLLVQQPGRLNGIDGRVVISHLACADEPGHPKNRQQLSMFRALRTLLPSMPASFANSSGIFLGADFHFEQVRPGAALYGVNPTPAAPNPMRHVATWRGQILQTRRIDSPETAGYGATHAVEPGSRLATVALGYADGLMRSLSNRLTAVIGGHAVPVVGRISMDSIILDVSALPDAATRAGNWAEIVCAAQDVNAVAKMADTIGYEIFSRIGTRVRRVHVGEHA